MELSKYNFIRSFTKKLLQLLCMDPPVKRIRLSCEEWKALTLELADEINELSSLLNKDLEH